MVMKSSPFQCLTLALLIIPPFLITTYFFAAFPNPPEPLYVHSSLASLPPSAKSWSIYPEDFYPGGDYITLPYGRVRYWLLGPKKGKKVVLIHGLSIPSLIWKDVAPELVSRGYRILVYDLYGRGYSDAPQTTYDARLYTMQLALLMQSLRWEKAILVGYSMGGGVAAAFTAQFPYLVEDKVVLISCAGLVEASDLSRTAKFMSSPLVLTLASGGPVRTYFQRLTNTSSPNSNSPSGSSQAVDTILDSPLMEIVRLQSAHLTGFNAAISSSLRDGPIRGQAASFSSNGFAQGRSVLLLHGTNDNTVHPRYAPLIFSLLPSGTRARSKLTMFDGAGHDLPVGRAEEVVEAMLDFFKH